MRILLKGFVADGVNEPSRQAVLLEDQHIATVEKEIIGSSAADKVFSFKDEIIAPGFIDVHGHSDLSLPAAPEGISKRSQGVTSEISGNCGLSAFPVSNLNRDHLNDLYANYGIDICWNDLKGYQQMLTARGVKLRTFPLCGHNTLRSAAAGYDKKELSGDDLEQMYKLLDNMLSQGAPGMSTGLLYTPGCFADADEITGLMRILAKHNAVYATHLRSEGDKLLESLEETLSCAVNAGLKKVQISHLKTAGKNNWHKLDSALDIIENFRAEGVDVRFDRYPYVESQTMLSVILPPPFDTMPDRDITIALQDETAVKQVKEALQLRSETDWARWRLTGTTHPDWKSYAGKKYCDLPGDKISAVIDQLKFDATTATIGAAGMSEQNMYRIITHNLCMPGSDGNALPTDNRFGTPHPRAFGAIAKYIRLKLDSGESIGKVTAAAATKPAEFFGLTDIGTISPGKKADITVFSPEEIDCQADFVTPNRLAEGIKLSVLDGEVTVF